MLHTVERFKDRVSLRAIAPATNGGEPPAALTRADRRRSRRWYVVGCVAVVLVALFLRVYAPRLAELLDRRDQRHVVRAVGAPASPTCVTAAGRSSRRCTT